MARDECLHGSLKRSCEVCTAEAELENFKAALKSSEELVDRLQTACKRSDDQAWRYWGERGDLLAACKIWKRAVEGDQLAAAFPSKADESLFEAIEAAALASENPETTEEGT